MAARSPLPNAETACLGFAAGYRVELRSSSFAARLSACGASFDNATVSTTTREYEASLSAQHLWDFSIFSAGVGLGAGVAMHSQSFETRGNAPDRQAVSPSVLVIVSLTADLYERLYLGLDARGETHFMKVQERSGAEAGVEPAFAVRGTLMGGAHF